MTILGFMEVSLSFDNAVVNAAVLKDMDAQWQRIFLTWGILFAVFGMRLLFPIVIVAAASGEGMWAVMQLAFDQPEIYAQHLEASHTVIATFGGIFLLLVFLNFLLDAHKNVHWLGRLEAKLAALGKVDSIAVIIALLVLLGLYQYLPIDNDEKLHLLLAGISGILLYILVDSLGSLFAPETQKGFQAATRNGIMGFIYLEILDASFSFDGVIGAFAITRDVIIIMLGLAIGAIFVRSITVYLVNQGTLDEYVFLEHGAHYAIGALALIMFYSLHQAVPEIITGLVGVAFIVASVVSSKRVGANRQSAK